MAQKGHRIEFQTQVTDFKELEKEFSKSQHNGSIMVLDVYTDWVGSCKVVVPYFQKIYLECNECCPLSFLCVNSDLVIQSLENAGFPLSMYKKSTTIQPSSPQHQQTPTKKKANLDDSLFADLLSPSSLNNSLVIQEGQTIEVEKSNLNFTQIGGGSMMDESSNVMEAHSLRSSIAPLDSSTIHQLSSLIADTDRQAWVPLVASVKGKSCPRFLFYKDGKLMEDISGVNISKISSLLKLLVDQHCTDGTAQLIENNQDGDFNDEPLNDDDDSLLSDLSRVNVDSHLYGTSLDF